MAIQKPRTLVVNFRVSEEEFAGLRLATNESDARSIADFCRKAILTASTGKPELHEVGRRLGHLKLG